MKCDGFLSGQSAIEYLMTYGWMLLVVAVVGGAIFSTVNSQGIETSSGFAGSDVSVENFGITSDNKMQIEVRNTASETVEIGSFRLEKNGELVQNYSGSEVSVGETEVITLNGVTEGESSEPTTAVIQYNRGDLQYLETSGTITGPISFEENASAPLMTTTDGDDDVQFDRTNLSYQTHGVAHRPTIDYDSDGTYEAFATFNRGNPSVEITDLTNSTWVRHTCDTFETAFVNDYQNNGEYEHVSSFRYSAAKLCNSSGGNKISTLSSMDNRFGNIPYAKADYDQDGNTNHIVYKNGTDGEMYIYDYDSDAVVDNFDFQMSSATPLDDYDFDGTVDEFLFTIENRDFLYIFDVSDKSYSKLMGIPTKFAYNGRIRFLSKTGDPLQKGSNTQILAQIGGGGCCKSDPYIIDLQDGFQAYNFGNESVEGDLGQIGDLGDLDEDGVRDDFVGNLQKGGFGNNWTVVYTRTTN